VDTYWQFYRSLAPGWHSPKVLHAREIGLLQNTFVLYMNLAVSLLANSSLSFRLYASFLDGESVQSLAEMYHLSETRIQEQIEAVRLVLSKQVRLAVNRHSTIFGPA
jgi:hypothetical protein